MKFRFSSYSSYSSSSINNTHKTVDTCTYWGEGTTPVTTAINSANNSPESRSMAINSANNSPERRSLYFWTAVVRVEQETKAMIYCISNNNALEDSW